MWLDVAYYIVLSRHLRGRAEENQEKPNQFSQCSGRGTNLGSPNKIDSTDITFRVRQCCRSIEFRALNILNLFFYEGGCSQFTTGQNKGYKTRVHVWESQKSSFPNHQTIKSVSPARKQCNTHRFLPAFQALPWDSLEPFKASCLAAWRWLSAQRMPQI
jgi:hypothetical protein